MNNIVIIEDNYDHFQIIGKLIADEQNDVFPKNINSGQELSDFLTPIRAMIDTTDATTRQNRKNEFFESDNLKQSNQKISISLYIIDYRLLADTNTINGLKFCEYVEEIREGKTPAILLTILDLDRVDVLTQRNEFTNKYPNSRIEFERKTQNKQHKIIKNWDENDKTINEIVTNSSDLNTRLKNTINRLCPQNDNSIRLEDVYEN